MPKNAGGFIAAQLATVMLVQIMPAQQVTEMSVTPIGLASLNSRQSGAAATALNSTPSGIVIPKHTRPLIPGAFALDLAHAALAIPNPRALQVVGPDANFFGFPALSVLDDAVANNVVFEPPDQGLTVGNGFVLEAVNLQLMVFDAQSGQRLTPPVALSAFFGLPPVFNTKTGLFGPFLSDPRCYFDHETQHWFLTVLEYDTDPKTGKPTGNSNILIAVSQTAGVLGFFNLFSLNTTDDGTHGTQIHPGCPCFGDQPLIGADRNGFYISTNEFPFFVNSFNGANIYAMSKQNLATGALTTVLHFSGIPLAEGLAFSVQPATAPNFSNEPASGVEYFLSSLDFSSTLDNRIAIWAMTNTRSLVNLHPNVTLMNKVLTSETYGFPPPAKQPGLSGFKLINNGGHLETIDSGDDRMMQVVYADGYLWSGLNTVIGTTQDRRAGIAYFIVQPDLDGNKLDATISSQGYVAVAGDSTIYPSIGVTSSGAAAMVMTLVGPAGTPVFPRGFFPSVAYTHLSLTKGPGDIRLAAPGMTPDDSFSADPSGTARWGDYTAAVADGEAIWIAGEWIPGGSRFTIADWGTFIGRVQ